MLHDYFDYFTVYRQRNHCRLFNKRTCFRAVLLIKDKRQKQHSVLRNYPLLARIRYFGEKIGPELRQYLFLADTKGKPFSRTITPILY